MVAAPASSLETLRDNIAEANVRFHSFACVAENIGSRPPGVLLAEQDDGGPAKFKDGLFFTAAERNIFLMHLNDTPYRQSAYFNETEQPKVLSLQELNMPLIAEKDVGLVGPSD